MFFIHFFYFSYTTEIRINYSREIVYTGFLIFFTNTAYSNYLILSYFILFTELTDPRSVSVDGGVFSRSIITPTRTPHKPSSSSSPDDCTSDITISNNNNSSRGAEQLQLLKSQMRDNRIRNFSSTYLSTGDWKANASLSTSLDGSRRR